jgi:hypothetical protein
MMPETFIEPLDGHHQRKTGQRCRHRHFGLNQQRQWLAAAG